MRLFRKNVMRLALRNKGAVFGSILIIGIGIFILVSMLDTLRNLDGQLAVDIGLATDGDKADAGVDHAGVEGHGAAVDADLGVVAAEGS